MLVNVLDKKKYAYMYETECFPKGIDKAFLSTSAPTVREYSMFEDILQKQGKILFPGPAKQLKI